MEKLSDAELEHFLGVAGKAAEKVSRDEHVVGQAANDALLKLIEHLDDVDPDKRGAWIRVVARNEARRAGKKAQREIPFGRQGTFPPPPRDEDGHPVPDDRQYMGLLVELQLSMSSPSAPAVLGIVVEQALRSLSAEARFLIEARYGAGRSSKDIAAELGKDPGTIDVAIYRARKALAPILAEDPRLS